MKMKSSQQKKKELEKEHLELLKFGIKKRRVMTFMTNDIRGQCESHRTRGTMDGCLQIKDIMMKKSNLRHAIQLECSYIYLTSACPRFARVLAENVIEMKGCNL